MEREPTFDKETESYTEHRDRFAELMEMRHRNAMAALKIEQILAHEEPLNEYPVAGTPENTRVKRETNETLTPILESLSAAGLTRKADHVKEAVDGYFVLKIIAQRAEFKLKEELQSKGKDTTPAEMGSELFRQRTGENPKTPVEAVRREGYFILVFFNDEDYLKFVEGLDQEKSAGFFHRAMRFPNMILSLILSRHGFENRAILHERQHFINDLILKNFTGIERRPVPLKKEFPLLTKGVNEQRAGVRKGLGGVKDELLAYIRDGSSFARATNFFGADLYKHLRDEFSEDEKKEVEVLLKKIRSELVDALNFFHDQQSRVILVYHLVDIPLLRFPERIKAITKFYDSKISEFTKFIPDEYAEEQVKNMATKRQLVELRSDITDKAYRASDMIVCSSSGGTEIDYDELQISLKDTKIKLEELRRDYDSLLAGSRAE